MKLIYPLALTATIAGAILTIPHQVKGEFDYVGLNNQVQHHQQVLDNHEARITNLEANTQVLQQATQTASVPQVDVPVVASTEATQATPTETAQLPEGYVFQNISDVHQTGNSIQCYHPTADATGQPSWSQKVPC